MFTIYGIRNIINNKQYIGCTNNYKRRRIHHISELERNVHGNKYLQNDWIIYKKENFEFYIIKETENNQYNLEEKYIILYNTEFPFGYNLTTGGLGVSNYHKSIEEKNHQSEKMMGKNNSLYGKINKKIPYYGVYEHRKNNGKYIYYVAKATIGSNSVWIGQYDNIIDAAIAYDNYIWNIYKDINHLNFPENFK